MTTRTVKPTPEHHAFRDDCIALLRKHAGHLPAEEMLALGCHLVGQMIALQDKRTMTKARVLELLIANVEKGNLEAMDDIIAESGGRA